MGINLTTISGGIANSPAVQAAKDGLGQALKALDSDEGKKIVDATIELTLTVVKTGIETLVPSFLHGYIEMGLGAAGQALESLVNGELDKLAGVKK